MNGKCNGIWGPEKNSHAQYISLVHLNPHVIFELRSVVPPEGPLSKHPYFFIHHSAGRIADNL